jgi:hypothetical protein
MKLNIMEKKVMYVFGCSDLKNSTERLKYLTALAVDPEAKRFFLGLTRKIESENNEMAHYCRYDNIRHEMDGYFRALRCIEEIESNTKEGNDYEEAV